MLNNRAPNCAACDKPKRPLTAANRDALRIWNTLDSHGRDWDTMAGNPLPLRLEAIELECAKHYDPDGMRLRVMAIEKRVLEARAKKKGEANAGKR